MANEAHLEVLTKGVEYWNHWRESHPDIAPDLTSVKLVGSDFKGINLTHTDLSWADLSSSNLSEADLTHTDLSWADLSSSNLSEADLSWSRLWWANLSQATLDQANLSAANLLGANLFRATLRNSDLGMAMLNSVNLDETDLTLARFTLANLGKATLRNALLIDTDLSGAHLNQANLENAYLSNCNVYGISAWDLKGTPKKQVDLIIKGLRADRDKGTNITVDDIELAQFIHLLLENKKLRNIIDTITTKVVLILGRFTPQRKTILDAVREAIRQRNYLPVLFDFEKPANRDTVETISTLAHMARFVIADLTEAKSVLQELQRIVPHLPSVPIQPLIQLADDEPGMVDYFRRFPWFLPLHRYKNLKELLESLDTIVRGAEQKVIDLRSM